MVKDRYLSRLIRAYPAQAKAQLDRMPPAVEAVASAEAVLAAFHTATDSAMGKAVALAVMLDRDECGESQLGQSAREEAAQLFEEIFTALANA